MKVLLLNPPNIGSQYINRDLMGGLGVNLPFRDKYSDKVMSFLKAQSIRLPVMSLAYSASILSKDHDVRVVDAANLSLTTEQTKEEIRSFNPDWLVSATSISALVAEADLVCQVKKEGSVKTVGLIGDAATLMSERILRDHDIDFIIRGDEPEIVFQEIVRENRYQGIKGVIHRQNGTIHDGQDPGFIKELDSLPFPKWELFPISAYRYFPILRQTPFLTVLSTRGCPYGCIYCPYTSNQGLKYRYRRAQDVIEELTYLRAKFHVRAVQFRDPTFTLREDRTLEICEGIIRNDLKLEWGCETRVDCLNEKMIDKMVESGLKGVNIGIESTDPNVIRNLKRGWIDPDRIRKTVTHMHNNGVRVSGFFIVGLPGETTESARASLDFALSIPLAYAEFKIATPFPGTPLFEMAQKNKWIDQIHLEDLTSYTPTMRIGPDLDSDVLNQITNEAYRKFYLRPAKILAEVFGDGFISSLARIVALSLAH